AREWGEWWLVSGGAKEDASGRMIWCARERPAYRVRYGDGTEFCLDLRESSISAHWSAASTFEDTVAYLLGPILGLLLRLRGVLCLHGSVIARGSTAFAVVGPRGIGKSTIAAAFALRGERILSDDVAAIRAVDGDFRVSPGYARLRLWPESQPLLFDRPIELPRISSTWDKRYLDLGDGTLHFEGCAKTLSAIYLLDASIEGEAVSRVESVTGRDALLALVVNTYPDATMLESVVRVKELQALGALAAKVPLRRIKRGPGPRQLSVLCDVIREDFDAVVCGADRSGQIRSA
ncbi:MAG: hypothetical protein ABIW79_02485, partial [Gemmatimonas sp.]